MTYQYPGVPGTREQRDAPLAPYTTMRVGGTAHLLVETRDADELVETVRATDGAGEPLLVLGGGSNIVVSDRGFGGTVARTTATSLRVAAWRDDEALVEVGVGTAWDDVASFAVENDLAGIEALSGIPGQIGSAVMQNLGAYGQEIGACLVETRLYDRKTGCMETHPAGALGLGYRTSMLRRSLEEGARRDGAWYPTPRWVVLGATLRLDRAREGVIGHDQLARALGCEPGTRMPLGQIRQAVLEVRAAKGMVADPDPAGPRPCYDRWSSGSFFTNPILSDDEARKLLPADAPRYATGITGTVKTSAAWLIERAGFPKGYGLEGPASRATLSALHTLALTNRGAARADDIFALARAVRSGVRERFGIELTPETVLVGETL